MYLPYEEHKRLTQSYRAEVEKIEEKIIKTYDRQDGRIALIRLYATELESLQNQIEIVRKQINDDEVLVEVSGYIDNLMHDCSCNAYLYPDGNENFMTSDEIQKSRCETAAWDEHYRTEGTMYRFRQI